MALALLLNVINSFSLYVDMIKKIVGHFKHSPLAYSRLEDLQDELKITPKRLQQDVQTRWSSTRRMIDSLLHQKWALHASSSEYNLPGILTGNQWGLLEKTSKVLAPFQELTTNVSAASATAADVIPSVHVLIRFLSKESEDDQGIQTMKAALLDAVRRRFGDVESEPLYALATLLDPLCFLQDSLRLEFLFLFLQTHQECPRSSLAQTSLQLPHNENTKPTALHKFL